MKKILITLAALTPAAAFAHTGHGETGLTAGLLHPVLGWDHLLAMVAVGMMAMKAQAGWRLPLAFVAAMVAGAGMGLAGMALPGLEPVIMMSVVVLGMSLALRMPLSAVTPLLCALFGLYHGNAHGLEAPAAGAAATFMAGFVLATGLLHGTGMLAVRYVHGTLLRLLGGLMAGAGLLAAM